MYTEPPKSGVQCSPDNMRRIAILYDASQAVLSTFDLDEVLNQILAIVRDYFHLQSGSILLLDEAKQELYVRARFNEEPGPGYDDVRIPIGKGITGTAVTLRRPVYVPDVSKDSRYIAAVATTRSELAIPLMVRDEVVGVLDCQSSSLDPFDKETIDLLTLFATQASIGLQNAKLYSLLQRRAAQLEVINAIAKQTTIELDIEELLAQILAQLPASFSLEHAAILLRDEDNNLIVRAQHGSLETRLHVGEVHVPDKNCMMNDADLGATMMRAATQCAKPCFENAQAEICLPLVSFGERIGSLICVSARQKKFNPNDIQALESVSDILATAIQNSRYVERVKQLAYRDGLTGVFNRRYFETRLVDEMLRSSRYGGSVSMLMIDIDHFKSINDEFGHLLGDEVLRQISMVFWKQLRKVDVVCRYGGEEFAIILPETSAMAAKAVAEKLRRAVAKTEIPGVPRAVTISIGIAEHPANGTVRDDVVRAADFALYQAKQSGRNCVRTATPATVAELTPRENRPVGDAL